MEKFSFSLVSALFFVQGNEESGIIQTMMISFTASNWKSLELSLYPSAE